MTPARRRALAGGMALALLIAGGAAATAVRRVWWATGETAYRGVHPGVETVVGVEWHHFREQGKVEIPDPGWRPLRVSLTLRPAPRAPEGTSLVVFAIDDREVHRAVVGPGPTEVEIDVTSPAGRDGPLGLQVRSDTFDEPGTGVGIASAAAVPVVSAWRVVRYAVPGAVLGGLLWWLWLWPVPLARRRAARACPERTTAYMRVWDTLALAAIAFALFLAWAILKPPLQAPDEPAHLARALASPNLAWLSRTSRVPVDGSDCNPLLDVPFPLIRVPFHEEVSLSRHDVASLRAIPWPRVEGTLLIRTQAWAHPPGFYHVVSLLGSAATGITGASPYESTYAYRLGVAALAAACWGWVFVALGHLALTRRQRWFVVALCLANPMVPLLASSVNPDALNLPLMVLALIYGHAAIVEQRCRRALFVVLVLASMTKPSALLMMATLATVAGLLVLGRRVAGRDALEGLRPVVAAAVVVHLVFGMWAPLAFYGGPRDLTLVSYWEELETYGWRRWVSFWAVGGWLDYQAEDAYYVAILWLLLANLVLGAPRLADDWRRAGPSAFVAIASGVFVAGALAAEFLYLARDGLNFQGRYLLPVMAGVALLLLHRWHAARWLFVGALVVLHLALAQRSIPRYYGDTATWCASVPWLDGVCGDATGDEAEAAPPPGLAACAGDWP